VAGRHGAEADEREEPILRKVPLDGEAAERVRSVEDEDGLPRRGARLHDEERRPDERVVAGADVGEVAHDGVEPREVLRLRREVLEPISVQRDDGEAPARRVVGPDGDHVLDGARQPVLRAEEEPQVETGLDESARRRDEA
jgi:hypothetical protein